MRFKTTVLDIHIENFILL